MPASSQHLPPTSLVIAQHKMEGHLGDMYPSPLRSMREPTVSAGGRCKEGERRKDEERLGAGSFRGWVGTATSHLLLPCLSSLPPCCPRTSDHHQSILRPAVNSDGVQYRARVGRGGRMFAAFLLYLISRGQTD